MNTTLKIAGVMTGTSCDGLDISCMQFDEGREPRVLWSEESPYPAKLRDRVLAAQLPGAKLSLREWGELHRDLGAWMGTAIAKIIAKHPTQQPDAIAAHGQTVAHFPAARKLGFTIQLAEPARIAEATGLTTITHFREGDMAAGGQGAPLAPRFHELMARGQTGIAIHNLGGISNLTYIGPRETLAFDTGPGNCWIDAATELATNGKRRFDKDGRLATQGQPDQAAVEAILRNKYFAASPPKSTGRDDFPFSLLQSATRAKAADLVATATAITVESIARAYDRFVPKLTAIHFCGGGARNKFLLAEIAKRLPAVQIKTVEDLGFDSKFLEAQAFAYFGYRALHGQALGGAWTGVTDWAPPAHITPGRNWPEILQKLARANPANPAKPARSTRHPK